MSNKKHRAEKLKQLNEVINAQSKEAPGGEENSGIWMMRTVHGLIESINNDLGK